MRPPVDSRVTPVLNALQTATADIDDLDVVIGAAGGKTLKRDVLEIAVGENAIGVTRPKARGLGMAYVEEMRILCRVRSKSGSTSPAARIVRCEEVRNAVRTALDASGNLGGVVDMVLLGTDEAWDVKSGQSGADVSVRFAVLTKTNT